jgi:nicotinamide-nucleotide amidase
MFTGQPSMTSEPPSDSALAALAARLGDTLRARAWTAATAESCTAGWIAKAMTDVPGSSAWFETGYVTYSNRAKSRELGIDERILAAYGAVSEPVARAMAQSARARSGADIAVAVSGIAGPGGGTAEKPVGTVWFCWATPGGEHAELANFGGSREAIRRRAVARALEGLLGAAAAIPAGARKNGG